MATKDLGSLKVGLQFNSSDLKSSLSTISSQMRVLDSEIRSGTSGFNAMGKSSDALKLQISGLTDKISLQKDKVAVLKSAFEDSLATKGKDDKATQSLQIQYNNSVTALNKMQSELNKTNIELENYGKETDNASEKTLSFGDVLKANVIGDIITAGLKAVANGMKAIGNAIGDVIGDSIKAYAEYEQLVGGVETLFGDSADTVKKYAENAYKTAGLSANNYMQQATSFSATLLQGLSGDTEAAAKYADIAISDMSDNANKMGTSIDMIQNAYQGFAKDNYTMLDNLKLGYGGTAGEMARLINDSGVMGDSFKATAQNVKEIPFDKMIEALHQTQEEMGITGTTAKEASETISGSLNSVKASWENVLIAISSGNDEQLTSAIDGIIEGIGNLATNVVKILPNIANGLTKVVQGLISQLPSMVTKLLPTIISSMKTLISSIINIVPELMPVVVNLLMELVNIIVENLPLIIDAGIVILLALITGIADSLPTLIPTIVEAVIIVVETLIDNIDLIIDAGIKITLALVYGLIDALPQLIDKIPVIIDKLIIAITNNLPKLIEAGVTLLVAVAFGLIKAIPQLITKLPQIISSIVKGLLDGLGSMAEVGLNLVKGIWNGISNATSWILDKIKGFGKSVLNGLKSFFGIASPSKLFADEIGKFIPEGIAVGIETNTDSVAGSLDKVKSMAKNMDLQYQYGLGAIDNTRKTVNTTVNSPINLTIEHFENNSNQDIKEIVSKMEYYRKQLALARGGN